MRSTGYLRSVGVNTPTYRADSWEVEWSNRQGKNVYARNPASKMPTAREWHYVDFHTLARAGVPWKPKKESTGRYICGNGYVLLNRRGMTQQDIDLSEKHNLWRGRRRIFVREHHLAAVKKYGQFPRGSVVRHMNGNKSDNRPENILLGTTAENTLDHVSARMTAMYWRDRCEQLERFCQSNGLIVPEPQTDKPQLYSQKDLDKRPVQVVEQITKVVKT